MTFKTQSTWNILKNVSLLAQEPVGCAYVANET